MKRNNVLNKYLINHVNQYDKIYKIVYSSLHSLILSFFNTRIIISNDIFTKKIVKNSRLTEVILIEIR